MPAKFWPSYSREQESVLSIGSVEFDFPTPHGPGRFDTDKHSIGSINDARVLGSEAKRARIIRFKGWPEGDSYQSIVDTIVQLFRLHTSGSIATVFAIRTSAQRSTYVRQENNRCHTWRCLAHR
jgi:hypothetical protein